MFPRLALLRYALKMLCIYLIYINLHFKVLHKQFCSILFTERL